MYHIITARPSMKSCCKIGLNRFSSYDCYVIIRHEKQFFNVRSKVDISQLNLPHETNNEIVKIEQVKSKKKPGILRSIGKQSGESVES